MGSQIRWIFAIACIPIIIYFIRGIYDFLTIKDNDQFFLAGRKLSTISFAINAAATNFSFLTAVFVMVTWSYIYGAAVWWTVISAVVGFIAYSIPKISPIKDTSFFSTGYTLHEYLGKRYNSHRVRLIASITTITAFIGFFVAELFVFASFLNLYININIWILIISLAIIIGAYTVLGGFHSVVKTDIYQFIFFLVGIACLIFILFSDFNDLLKVITNSLNPIGLFKAVEPFQGPPPLFIVMLFIINGLWQFSAMDMWQRSLATKEQKRISRAAVYGALIFASITVPIIFIGTSMKLQLPTGSFEPFELISRLIQNQPLIISSGLIVLFVSALLSTADSNLIALCQSVLYDVIGSFYQSKSNPSLSTSRITILIIIACALLLFYVYTSLSKFDLITFVITFFSCQIVLFPSIIYAVFRPNYILPHQPAIWSIFFGYSISLVLGFYSIKYPILQFTTPVLSLGFSSAIFLVIIAFYKERPIEQAKG